MSSSIRAAFFPDSYLEVNGAAMTSKRLTGYAQKMGYPFLCIHAGPKNDTWQDESTTYLSLKRSPFSFTLDEDLAYDPLFQRHMGKVLRSLMQFQPDVIHITGLNDVSIVGAYLAWKLQIPLVGSWHTNIHEFAATRLDNLLSFAPDGLRGKVTRFAEKNIMYGSIQYYRMPKVILAPNQELIDALRKGTNRSARLMSRGVDTDKFSPHLRTANDGVFRIGSVGRLRAEKNVRMLVELEKNLLEAGKTNFEFLIVGEGTEREYLEKNLGHAKFTGFLSGEELSQAYANMDVFVFPSMTDAYGNVAQEAHASGVPSIVSDQGGPKFIVSHGKTGFIAKDVSEFTGYTIGLMEDPSKLEEMKEWSRASAMSRSWDSVFESVYAGYAEAISLAGSTKFAGEREELA
ncbi:MAG: glycosyltransferase [bacterium]|nr:glycosyltransferase [bacterium]